MQSTLQRACRFCSQRETNFKSFISPELCEVIRPDVSLLGAALKFVCVCEKEWRPYDRVLRYSTNDMLCH